MLQSPAPWLEIRQYLTERDVPALIPLLLKRWQIDPAIASGPVLTTVTDMSGFFLVLGLATLALPWL